jgi:hypothetical protein
MRWTMPGATILGATMLLGTASAQMPPPVPPASLPANCTAPEHRQFDFWIGEWRVFNTDKPDEILGVSTIEPVYNGCGIRENWQPFTMLSGGSLNSYDPRDRRWKQTWIDSTGARVEFVGGLEQGRMVLTGLWRSSQGAEKDFLQRMTLYPEGGTVRQIGEDSRDGGKSWFRSFDFTYRPRKMP